MAARGEQQIKKLKNEIDTIEREYNKYKLKYRSKIYACNQLRWEMENHEREYITKKKIIK